MSITVSIILFIVGLGLVMYSAEKLVEGVVGISIGFGVSAFLISTIFIGFDPENLAVGAVGAYESSSGIALGSVIGATMVAVALSFGITALIAPMKFEKAPTQILSIPVLGIALFWLLSLDGMLSRIDGVILFAGYFVAVMYLLQLEKKGVDIEAEGEVGEALEELEEEGHNKWKSLIIFIVSLIAIVIGSELLVSSSKSIIASFGLTETVFGMTILSFLISIEELARELPAAMKGRPEISFGNVSGSVMAFFLFNAGIMAMVRPVTVDAMSLRFYIPMSFASTAVVSAFMATKKVGRLAGAVFVILYIIFLIVSYL